jgi:hypothetical protein
MASPVANHFWAVEVEMAVISNQSAYQSEMICMQVGNKKIGMVQVNIKLLKPFIHGIKAFFAVETGVDDQVSVVRLDYV